MYPPILTADATPEEILTALAELGEDPAASRVQAVQAQLAGQVLSAGGREDAVRLAVDAARRQLDAQEKVLQIPILKVGDKFTLATNETDNDEHDRERVTPAGRIWRVLELEPDCDPVMQYSVACDVTGGWIHITHNELSKCGYRAVADPESLNQALPGGERDDVIRQAVDAARQDIGEHSMKRAAKDAIQRYHECSRAQEFGYDCTVNPEGKSDEELGRQVDVAYESMLAALAALGDDDALSLLSENNAVDHDGSSFLVVDISTLQEWRKENAGKLQEKMRDGPSQDVALERGGTRIAEAKEAGLRSVNAAEKAVEAHRYALGIEGDASTQVWHLLASLHEFCATNSVDLDAQLADVRRQFASGEIELPLARASQRKRDGAPGLSM